MASVISRNSTNVRSAITLAWQRARFAVQSAIAPDRAAVAAARLFATPPRHAHTPRELELLATGTRYTVRAREGELEAWRFGRPDRPAVVLVHGWGGRGAQLRAFVPALLERGYQVALFDHFAHGHSSGREATLVHFANAIDAVVADLEARGVRVDGFVGHSLGAAAVGLWLKESGRALRAALIAPPISVERYSGYFARALGIPERVRRAMQERFERMLGRRWSEFELPHAIEGMKAKALVIHDAGDREVAFSAGLALARAWPDARLVRTEGLGHRLVLRDPGVVRDAVDFIGDRVVFLPPPARGESRPFGAPAPIA